MDGILKRLLFTYTSGCGLSFLSDINSRLLSYKGKLQKKKKTEWQFLKIQSKCMT